MRTTTKETVLIMQSTHTIRRTLPTLLIALLAIVAPRSLAQESHNPAGECIEHVQQIAQRNIVAMHRTADRRVEAIQALDANNAEESRLREVAREGRQNINERATRAAARVQEVVSRCVQRLMDNDAPAPVIASVVAAGHTAIESIASSRDHNTDRINRSLRIALNN